MIRFILFACMAFATTFVGVFWALRGFPAYSYSPVGELKPTLNRTFGDESAKAYDRKMWEAEHTAMSDKDPKLDLLRMDALQAGNAYAMSPCDATMKANLISAVTAYTRAWQKTLDCPRPMGMMVMCSDTKIDGAAAKFTTPLDIRVKAALNEAFEQKGIVRADFPEDVQQDMLAFAGPGLWFDESPVCKPTPREASRR
jgi:hypothetical protein